MTANAGNNLFNPAGTAVSHATREVDSAQANSEVVTEGLSGDNGTEAAPTASSETDPDADEDDEDDEDDDTVPKDQTMKPIFKRLDKRYDEDGNKVYIERKDIIHKSQAGKRAWWDLFALCEIRHYDDDGDLDQTRLHVNSQLLKQLLEDVIGDFPNESLDASADIELDTPAHCLFFYRKELETEGKQRFADDKEGRAHLEVLLEYIDTALEDEFRAHRRAMASESRAITYEHLWTLFKPGTTILSHVLGQPRAFELLSFVYRDEGDDEGPGLWLQARFIDYDGEKFGTRVRGLLVPKYSGSMRCDQLNAAPLDLLPQSLEIRRRLIERGSRFERLAGQNYKNYSGAAVKRKQTGPGYDRFSLTGRVMVDCKTYHRLDPQDGFGVEEIVRSEAARRQRVIWKYSDNMQDESARKRLDYELLDEDRLLASATVRGYAFTHKKFLEFFVDNISDIKWNSECFNQLVLDPRPKQTIQALVSMHARRNSGDGPAFDDIIEGKGRGLVMVLHGEPGVGKTLTAECVAEWVRRPLYAVSSGELGFNSMMLEQHLTRIMDMTSTWNAVLLIDEADVFLERRSAHDMQRNGMVSVFLRVLEYYTGILFLTTNRVATFDDAFKSRIHVPLRYGGLNALSRGTIWKNFFNRVPGGVDVTEDELLQLSRHELNGRQIKNIVRTAESLAAYSGTRLDFERLEEVTRIQAEFEEDLVKAAEAGLEGV